ncbi:DUF6928 family protein [Methylomonas methanica]|uniref:Uncharacterized protein n=1 Tax=Methylomonas methanica (strain DSM 25384 / MC09) TaxID=857087 RepID=F9ZZJ3_METMM|nr:hypothetical protein [Methylomonas methanica]AEG02386.1 hypothetical protein Metme_4033 [Methylomonas methanica MC09]
MGAKTWMLVYSDGDASDKLRGNPTLDRAATDKLVKTLFPHEKLETISDGDLSYTCPPDNIIYAGCFAGVAVLAAKEFAGDYPSKLDRRFIAHADGRCVYLHAMHSVVDWLAFAKWEKGKLLRSLSLSPDTGILEDLGNKLPFETAYWEGRYPAIDPDDNAEDDYQLPFHPLDLGEEVLKAFFGYQLEGTIDDSLLEPENIPLIGYKRKKYWWKFW